MTTPPKKPGRNGHLEKPGLSSATKSPPPLFEARQKIQPRTIDGLYELNAQALTQLDATLQQR